MNIRRKVTLVENKAYKFSQALHKSFKAENISYECKEMLETAYGYSLAFLTAIKQMDQFKINMLINLSIHECVNNNLTYAYNAFKNQIESDERLFNSFLEYSNSIKEIQIEEIASEIAQQDEDE